MKVNLMSGTKFLSRLSSPFAVLAVILILGLSSCANGLQMTAVPETKAPASQPPSAGSPPRTLRVMTHDSFAISESVLEQFQTENRVQVQFIKSGDAGTALNKAILSADKPLADVFYGVDNTFLSRALEEDIFEPYASQLLSEIPSEFQLDPQQRALPVDYGDVCLNYDRAYFNAKEITPPSSLDDLLKPEYRGLLVVQNPATSSPGLAFLLATIGVYGPDGYLEFWEKLVENEVLVVNDWETAYYTEFSGSSGKGPRPLVVSYNSSPPFEVIYAETPIDEPPTAAVTADNSCFRQIEFVGILKGTKDRAMAEKWVDFMLSVPFQQDVPLQMFVFPVNPQAQLEETFEKFLDIPSKTVQVDPQMIAENREEWLQAWTETVLR